MPGNPVFTGSGLGSGVGLRLCDGSGLAEGDGLADGGLGEGEATACPAWPKGPISSRQVSSPPSRSAKTAATGQKGIRERAA
jgi:hypothetical protein